MYTVEELQNLPFAEEVYLEVFEKKKNKPVTIQHKGMFKKGMTVESSDESYVAFNHRGVIGRVILDYDTYGVLWKAYRDEKSAMLEKML